MKRHALVFACVLAACSPFATAQDGATTADGGPAGAPDAATSTVDGAMPIIPDAGGVDAAASGPTCGKLSDDFESDDLFASGTWRADQQCTDCTLAAKTDNDGSHLEAFAEGDNPAGGNDAYLVSAPVTPTTNPISSITCSFDFRPNTPWTEKLDFFTVEVAANNALTRLRAFYFQKQLGIEDDHVGDPQCMPCQAPTVDANITTDEWSSYTATVTFSGTNAHMTAGASNGPQVETTFQNVTPATVLDVWLGLSNFGTDDQAASFRNFQCVVRC